MTQKETINQSFKTCTYENFSGKEICKEPSWQKDSDGKCIYHSENVESKKVIIINEKKIKFNDLFHKKLKNENEDHDIEKLNFIGYVFPSELSFRGFVFKKPVDFSFSTFKEATYFTGDHLKKIILFEKAAHFTLATFEKPAYFTGITFKEIANFYGVIFKETANFPKVTFEREARFISARLKKEVDFSEAIFEKEADFSTSTFKEKASFYLSKFRKKADFSKTIFEKETCFTQATFEEETLFKNIKSIDYIRFDGARFFGQVDNPADFSCSTFKGKIDFNGAEFGLSNHLKKKINLLSTTEIKESNRYYALSPEFVTNIKSLNQSQINSGNVCFKEIEVNGNAEFSGIRVFFKEVNFREAKFDMKLVFNIERKHLEKVSMVETSIYDLIGVKGQLGGKTGRDDDVVIGLLEGLEQRSKEQKYIFSKWPFLNLSKIKRRIKKKKLVAYIWTGIGLEKLNITIPYWKFHKPKFFRYLSEKFSPILGEKAEARYPIAVREIKDDRFLMRFKQKHGCLFRAWWLFADCGRSTLRWALWCLGVALFFTIIYTPPSPEWFPDWWIDLCEITGPQFEQTSESFSEQSPSFWSLLYFSIVTFTTLGFGDIVAANIIARIYVTIEVIMGYIMLGLLIGIGINRFARRS